MYMSFCFFFFKQKTAYEISACLVGSEMCIRDSCRRAQTVILSVGGTDLKDTFLTDEGTYNLSVYNKIVHSGGVGDIAGRNFDINGNEIQSNITGRIISISLSELKQKRNRICIAIGEHKSQAILGALRGGLSLIHISEPTRQAEISYAVFCLKKKKKKKEITRKEERKRKKHEDQAH